MQLIATSAENGQANITFIARSALRPTTTSVLVVSFRELIVSNVIITCGNTLKEIERRDTTRT
jgi:hypothetical protein